MPYVFLSCYQVRDLLHSRYSDNLAAKQNSLAKAKQKLEHWQALIGTLEAERDALVTRQKQVMQRLQAEKDQYVQLNQVGNLRCMLCLSSSDACCVCYH